jgi:hypothetical protein
MPRLLSVKETIEKDNYILNSSIIVDSSNIHYYPLKKNVNY